MISAKTGSDLLEGIRLSFNAMYWADKSKGYRGYKALPNKIQAEEELRNWFFVNLDGLPEREENNPEELKINYYF